MKENGQKAQSVPNGNISVLQSKNKTNKKSCPMTFRPM